MTPAPHRLVVVGSGTRFLSGISYYTHKLASALAERHEVGVILMRRIMPRRLYPGRVRVGAPLTELRYPPEVDVYDGVDWFWFPSILRAAVRLWRSRAATVIFQWWTGAVLHSYILLALVARLRRARVVIEFHEVQDTGEARFVAARVYVRVLAGLLTRLACGSVIHSEHDRDPVARQFGMGDRPIVVIPHGPFDQYISDCPIRTAPVNAFNVLFFGTIRPYKGLEDLILAFDSIPEDEIHRYWLTVVGETWEGWILPAELIGKNRHRDRITFVNRYVTDSEAAGYFAGADAVALPYHRSSASGPLHIAMSTGLPVVVTNVGGLSEAAGEYEGALFVAPNDPNALRAALPRAMSLAGRHFSDPHAWSVSTTRYEALFASIQERGAIRRANRNGGSGNGRTRVESSFGPLTLEHGRRSPAVPFEVEVEALRASDTDDARMYVTSPNTDA